MKFVDFVKNSISSICAKYLNDDEEIEYLPIFYIAGSQTLPPPLPPEEEEEMIKRLSEENNLEARQILVERNLRLVVCIANEILMFLRKSNKLKGEISIDEPLNKDGDGNELLLSDILGTEPDITSRNLEDEVDKTLLRAAILKLNEREKDIMEMRFGFNTGKEKTQKEVADELRNITKLHIKTRKKDNK